MGLLLGEVRMQVQVDPKMALRSGAGVLVLGAQSLLR